MACAVSRNTCRKSSLEVFGAAYQLLTADLLTRWFGLISVGRSIADPFQLKLFRLKCLVDNDVHPFFSMGLFVCVSSHVSNHVG